MEDFSEIKKEAHKNTAFEDSPSSILKAMIKDLIDILQNRCAFRGLAPN